MGKRRKNNHIEIMETRSSIRSRLDWGDYYSVESIVQPSITYVLDEDVIAIVHSYKGTVLLSPDIIEELIEMYKVIEDPDNQRIFREMAKRREKSRHDKQNSKSVKSGNRGGDGKSTVRKRKDVLQSA